MYRDQSMMRHQCFCNSDWAGGVYATPTLAGGRDGGAVATAWATLLGKVIFIYPISTVFALMVFWFFDFPAIHLLNLFFAIS